MGTLDGAVRSAGELPSRKIATRRFGCLTVRRFTSIMMQMILQLASWKTMLKTHTAIVLTILAFSASATAQTEVDKKDYGSIEKGKVANLFVSDGDPFETKTNIKHLFINGWNVPLESRHTYLYDEFLDRSPGLDR